jgi:Kef-type K+ transport system membrane component KefB
MNSSTPLSAPSVPDIVPDMLWLVLFFAALYCIGAIFSLFYSRMIGQIVAGILFMGLGTRLLRGEEFYSIAGWIGLGILVFEGRKFNFASSFFSFFLSALTYRGHAGGASLDMKLLRKVFLRASLLAFFGSLLPVVFGIVYISVILGEPIVSGLASGASLASTSIAVALILMQQHKIVETKIGTLLTAAAMLDDVFSLVLVAVVSSLGSSAAASSTGAPATTVAAPTDPSKSLAVTIIRPIVASIAVLIVGTFAARMFQIFFQRVTTAHNSSDREISRGKGRCRCCRVNWIRLRRFIRYFLVSHPHRQEFFVCIMCAYAFAWSITSVLSGSSYLIGAFVAGLAFSSAGAQSASSQSVAMAQQGLQRLDQIKSFLLAIFFGSIGFSLKTSILFEGWALLYGALIYTIIMIIAKMLTGFLATPLSWGGFLTVASAMVGRGELGLYLSEQAQKAGVMSSRVFAATTWALILNTFVSPILFSLVVKRYPIVSSDGDETSSHKSDGPDEDEAETRTEPQDDEDAGTVPDSDDVESSYYSNRSSEEAIQVDATTSTSSVEP